MGELEGAQSEGPHNFITLRAPKGHNLYLVGKQNV